MTQPVATAGAAPEATGQEIARFLEENKGIDRDSITHAFHLAAQQESSPWSMLLRLGLVAENDLVDAFEKVLGIQPVAAEDLPREPLFEQALSPRFLRESRALPLQLEGNRLHLAMADPTDLYVREAVSAATGHPVVVRVAPPSSIEAALAHLYGEGRSAMEEITENLEPGGEASQDTEILKDLASEAPVVRLVNLLLQQALEARASDIHLEPFENRLRVRFRVDGVLLNAESMPASSAAAVISRIKLMAHLDIAERRLPQDGRFSFRIEGRALDLRVSTIPTLFGESLVIRVLDKGELRLDFEVLGFSDPIRNRLEQLLEAPHGILLVTGPTGSGKSTTLYTAIDRLNSSGKKILTVEDPVEYRLDGINQIQVKPQIGLDFSVALRAIVRQDPDIIMVGEMRDLETTRIAVHSALTGHLVLSTLHTNDAASGITRLLDMGVEPYLITATVNGIVAQRLIRRLCRHCAEPFEPPPQLLEKLRQQAAAAEEAGLNLFRAVGCSHCSGTGYLGRLAIAEILLIDDALRQLTMQRTGATALRQAATERGMRTLHQDGLHKVFQGLTTLEEVARVTAI